jgi:hypothetical protein
VADSNVTLYSPNGEKYVTGSRTEITRLKAQGYTEKKQSAPKSDAK